MPLNLAQKSELSYDMSALMGTAEFNLMDDSDKGLQLNQVLGRFATDNNIQTEEDKRELEELSAKKFQDYRDNNLISRYIPTPEEQQKYYAPLEIESTGSKDDQIKKIDEWKQNSLKQASTLRPANSEDFEYHLNSLANEQIRQLHGKDTSWLGDKVDRLVQGVVEPVSRLAFGGEPTDRFFAENLAENPKYDQDFAAQVSAGIGDTLFQASTSLLVGATAGPEASVAVLGLYNTSRMMRDSYEQEMQRTGNSQSALTSAIAQIPSAAMETFADTVVFGSLAKLSPAGKNLRKAFMEAGTHEAKIEILKEAIPTLGGAVLKGGISEGILGGVGSEFASGYGSYLATGDEKYLRSVDQLVQSGLVEGTVGALFGGAMSGIEKSHAAGEAAQDLHILKSRQNEIYQALKSNNYQGVIDIVNRPLERERIPGRGDAIEAAKAKAALTPTGKPGEVQVTNLFSPGHLAGMRKIKAEYEAADPERKAELQEDYDRVAPVLDGTYKPTNEFQLDFKPNQDVDSLTTFTSKKDSKVAAKPYSSFEVTLEDGSLLPDDNPTYVVYTNNPLASQQAFNQINVLSGTPTVALSENGGKMRIVSNSKKSPLPLGKTEIPISWKPSAGKTPIAIYDVINENGDVVGRKVKILSKVKSAEKFVKKDNYAYMDSIFDEDGNLMGVKVKHNGKEVALYGQEAFEIAKNERDKSNKVIADKIVNRVEQGQQELADLQAQLDELPDVEPSKFSKPIKQKSAVEVAKELEAKGLKDRRFEGGKDEVVEHPDWKKAYNDALLISDEEALTQGKELADSFNDPHNKPTRDKLLEYVKNNDANSIRKEFTAWLRPESKKSSDVKITEQQAQAVQNIEIEKPVSVPTEINIPGSVRVSKDDTSKFLDGLDDGNYEVNNGDNKFTLAVRTNKGKKLHVLTTSDGVIQGKKEAITAINKDTKLIRNDSIPQGVLTTKTLSGTKMEGIVKLLNSLKNNEPVSNEVLDDAISTLESKANLVKDMEDPEGIREELIATWETLVEARRNNDNAKLEDQNKNIDTKNPPFWIKNDPRFKELAATKDTTEEDLQERIQQIIEENDIKAERTRLGDFEGRTVTVDGITGVLSIDAENKGIITTPDGKQYETVNWTTPVSEMSFQDETFVDPAVAAIDTSKKSVKLVNRNPVQINHRGILVNKNTKPFVVRATSVKARPIELTVKERAAVFRLRKQNDKAKEKAGPTPKKPEPKAETVKIKDFDENGKLKSEVELTPQEALDKLTKRKKVLDTLKNCLNS